MLKCKYLKWGMCFFIGLGFILLPGFAAADTRTDYLIDKLENGTSYRVRVQAATTLGVLRSKKAAAALKKALADENELVVISAATSLGQIGDPSSIPDLENALKNAKSEGVKSQLEATIRILDALLKSTQEQVIVDNTPRFVIRVDSMGNSSGLEWEGILDTFRNIVIARVSKEPGVVMQPESLTKQELEQMLKKDKLAGYALSGSLIKLEKTDSGVAVQIGLNVLTNPGYSLLMMPTVSGSLSTSRDNERAAYEKAIATVVDKLVKTIFNQLRQMDAVK